MGPNPVFRASTITESPQRDWKLVSLPNLAQ